MSEPIAIIPLDQRRELRVTLESNGNHMRLHQRVWFLKDGGWRPSTEGLGLSLRALAPLAEVMRKVSDRSAA